MRVQIPFSAYLRGCTGFHFHVQPLFYFVIVQHHPQNDDCIAVTSDHGNMNGHKGKLGYAYDVYECEIRIPLITPRKECIGQYNELTSTVDLYELLFGNKIPKRTIVYSDSAYRAQNHRKLAIVSERYKYIYNKETDSEELYDLYYDPSEEFSLMEDYIFDPDRKVKAPSRELYYYPDWDLLPSIRSKMRQEKDKIWKTGSSSDHLGPS